MSDLKQHRYPTSRISPPPAVATAIALALMLAVTFAQSARAQTYSVLYSFEGSPDGANPYGAGVIRDAQGNLYGTTYVGGTYNGGTVFRVSRAGQETVLHSFTGSDGANPFGGVIKDASGNLYGTTSAGGDSGYGTVFRVSKTGKETLLYSFCSQSGCIDGKNPSGGVIRDANGNLYGTTTYGGAAGYGTVFEVSKTGKETVLYSFAGGTDGANPYWGVIRDAAGNLYGTTTYGGTGSGDCSPNGPNCGTVFKLSRAGKETVLYSLKGGSDGGTPNGGVVLDVSGNLYGTAYYGGASGYGTVFRVSRTGKEIVLHNFNGSDGANPFAGLIRNTNGNIYGTTYGDEVPYGTVFKLSEAGKETVLYTFTGGPDGTYPAGTVIRDAVGNLFGTTRYGGASGDGVVFKLTPN